MVVADKRRLRGRPRDSTIDDRVLAATRDLLVEVGFSATTMHAIEKRSGVPNSAIYRRWPSRIALIEAAVAPPVPDLGPPTGKLERDLRRFETALRAAFTTPVAQAAVPALLAAYQEGQSGRPAEAWLRDSWRPPFYEMLEAAGSEAVDSALPPDDLFDLLLGSIFVQAFVPTTTMRQRRRFDVSRLICRLVQPKETR